MVNGYGKGSLSPGQGEQPDSVGEVLHTRREPHQGVKLKVQHQAANPLGFCRGAYVSFGFARDAVRAAEEDDGARLLALVEHEEAILFERDAGDGALSLPSASGSARAPWWRRSGIPSSSPAKRP